ncbi:calcium-binding protein [Paracoccus sp. N5]|uniref:calcium-binding protein n=1 Tax=Paracoccus sp. N5 TaxID=1101189 RepID=UPI0009D9B9A8|nr:calcium-binding protein [Paracoccus sp. N5]
MRRLNAGMRQLPGDAGVMDIMLRNCVPGDQQQALAPLLADSIGVGPVGVWAVINLLMMSLAPLPVGFAARLLHAGVNPPSCEMMVPGNPPYSACPPRQTDMLVIARDSSLTVPRSPAMRLPGLAATLSGLSTPSVKAGPQAADPARIHLAAAQLAASLRPAAQLDPAASLGGDGADRLYGQAGNDSLFCGNGNDTLYGDMGDDLLGSGLGDDWLGGGAGADRLLGGPAMTSCSAAQATTGWWAWSERTACMAALAPIFSSLPAFRIRRGARGSYRRFHACRG